MSIDYTILQIKNSKVIFIILIILIVCGVWGYDGLSHFTLYFSKMFELYYYQFLQEAL